MTPNKSAGANREEPFRFGHHSESLIDFVPVNSAAYPPGSSAFAFDNSVRAVLLGGLEQKATKRTKGGGSLFPSFPSVRIPGPGLIGRFGVSWVSGIPVEVRRA